MAYRPCPLPKTLSGLTIPGSTDFYGFCKEVSCRSTGACSGRLADFEYQLAPQMTRFAHPMRLGCILEFE